MFEEMNSHKNQDVRADFHIGSDCEIRLFVLDLETTYVTHFPEVSTVSKI